MVDLILQGIGKIFGAIVNAILILVKAIFADVLWNIASILLSLLDFVQMVFRRLAGLPVDTGKSSITSEFGEDDILLQLFRSEIIRNTLIALVILALCLLFIATFVQIARVEFTEEGAKNSKTPIIAQALKALAMFFIVPVTCAVGVVLSNFVLRMVDTATKGGSSNTVAGMIFKVGAYDANIVRTETGIFPTPKLGAAIAIGASAGVAGAGGAAVAGAAAATAFVTWIVQLISNKIDGGDAYAKFTGSGDGTDFDAEAKSVFGENGLTGANKYERADALDNYFAMNPGFESVAEEVGDAINGTKIEKGDVVNYTNNSAVRYFYNIMNYNFLMVFIAAPLAMKALFHACFGLIMRIYNVLILFVISPPVVALMPLDGGNAYKNWRQKFIGNVISAYGTVAGLNLFFQILPLVNEIDFFKASTGDKLTDFTNGFYNQLVRTLFVLVGCFMIQDISKMISGIIGAEDAMSSGEGMAKKVGEPVKKATSLAIMGGMAVASGGMSLAGKIAGKVGASGLKGLGALSPEAASKTMSKKKFNSLSNTARNKMKDSDPRFKNMSSKEFNDYLETDDGKTKFNEFLTAELNGDASKVGSFGKHAARVALKKAGVENTRGMSVEQIRTAYAGLGADERKKAETGLRGTMYRGQMSSERSSQLLKGMGVQLIAGSATGKLLNEATGGVFKLFGGKGINQFDGAISAKSDIHEEMVTQYTKIKKQEKQEKQERKLGRVYEVMSALNQQEVNKQLFTNNIRQAGEKALTDVSIREDSINNIIQAFISALRNNKNFNESKEKFMVDMNAWGAGEQADKIAELFGNILKNNGTKGFDGDFLRLEVAADDVGTVMCKFNNQEPIAIDASKINEAIKTGMDKALDGVLKINIDDQGAANNDFIDKLTRNLSTQQQKDSVGKSAARLNQEMISKSSAEKGERGDIKQILQILKNRL